MYRLTTRRPMAGLAGGVPEARIAARLERQDRLRFSKEDLGEARRRRFITVGAGLAAVTVLGLGVLWWISRSSS